MCVLLPVNSSHGLIDVLDWDEGINMGSDVALMSRMSRLASADLITLFDVGAG